MGSRIIVELIRSLSNMCMRRDVTGLLPTVNRGRLVDRREGEGFWREGNREGYKLTEVTKGGSRG